MRQNLRYITADNADLLDGTDLTTIDEGHGVEIYITSSQSDTVVLITVPGQETPATKVSPQVRANGLVAESDDPGLGLVMTETGHIKIDVDIDTAATVGVLTKDLG